MVPAIRDSLLFARCVLLHKEELLAAVIRLALAAVAAGERELGDGSFTAAELEAALRALPRGNATGLDGMSHEVYQPFWGVLRGILRLLAFCAPGWPAAGPHHPAVHRDGG